MPPLLKRIFLSSPGDVAEERALAERALNRLAEEFKDSLRLELFLWEHEPIFAHSNYQEQTPLPSQCDLVICVLWSRLGTRLPVGFASNAAGEAPTGTEFEVEDALSSYRKVGRPNLLIYRRVSSPQINVASPDARERLQQYERLDEFCRRAFYDEDGSVIVAHHSYEESHEFEKKLGEHARRWIERQSGEVESRPRWTHGSPYRGLLAFEAEHREVYFGRSQAVSELIGHIRESESQAPDQTVSRFLLVQGMSGNGKSSLVRAGLLPLLEGRAIEGIGLWLQLAFKPSFQPTEDPGSGVVGALIEAVVKAIPSVLESYPDVTQLAARISAAPGESAARLDGFLAQEALRRQLRPDQIRLVIFIDQLEELFEKAFPKTERDEFISILHALTREGRIWVIATLRSDFGPRLEEYPTLVQLTRNGHFYVLGPPRADELADMIREPALAAGLRWEEREGVPLNQAILRDAVASPESLPLLEYALDQLYVAREGRRLTFAAYSTLGGLQGGISKAVEAILTQEDLIDALPKVLRGLVSVDENGTAMRRYAPLSEFPDDSRERVLVQALIAKRLCVTDRQGTEAVVTFAHESLINTWPRVQAWLRTETELLQNRDAAIRDSRLWQQHGKADSWLVGADRLAGFKAVGAAGIFLPAAVESFIELSERHIRRAILLKRSAVAIIAVLALAASIAAWVARSREKEAQYQTAKVSRTQLALLTEAAAQKLKDGDLTLAKGIILDVLRRQQASGYLDPAAVTVFQEIRANDPSVATFTGHTKAVIDLAYSPDGSQVASASLDRTARIWDAHTGLALHVLTPGRDRSARSVAYSADGQHLLVASKDSALIWDTGSGRLLATIADPDGVYTAAFSPDGNRIVTTSKSGGLKIWNASTTAIEAHFEHLKAKAESAEFSADGQRILSVCDDNSARIWDARSGAELLAIADSRYVFLSARFSPDASRVLTVSRDVTLRLWDAQKGALLSEMTGQRGQIFNSAYSRDGAYVASASTDKTVRIWDAKSGKETRLISGHVDIVGAVAFSPDSSRLVSGGWDTTIRSWNLKPQASTPILLPHLKAANSISYSSDNRFVVTTSDDGLVRIWDAKSGRLIRGLEGHKAAVNSAVFSNDGKLLVSTSDDHTVKIWDSERGTSELTIPVVAEASAAAFSPDATRVVASLTDLSFAVYDRHTGKVIGEDKHSHHDYITSIEYSPDGRNILTASIDKNVRVWDAQSLKQILVLPHADFVNAAHYSADGARIVSASNDNHARVWDARTGAQLLQLTGHAGYVNSARFSPDGSRIVTGSWDRTIRLWDADSGQPVNILLAYAGAVGEAVFSPDGAQLATVFTGAAQDNRARLWDSSPPARLDAQITWERAVESDPLSEVQRTQMGVSSSTTLIENAGESAGYQPISPRTESDPPSIKCAQAAGAYYDPERVAAGLEQTAVNSDIALLACTDAIRKRGRSPQLTYHNARALVAKGSYAEARKEFERASSAGYRAADVDLGLLLSNPDSSEADPRLAIQRLKQAWNNGVLIGGFYLGVLFERGFGNQDGSATMAADNGKAWEWYESAAKRGEAHSIARLAHRAEMQALTSGRFENDPQTLNAFRLYAEAVARSTSQQWPASVWRPWCYRRSTLAQLLGHSGKMQVAADAYREVVGVSSRVN